MSWEPIVSFVVPYYNQSTVVEKSVQSLLALDYPVEKRRLILVDDGSTDGTGDLLDRFHEEPGVTLIHHTSNKGRSEVRNSGINRADGEVVCFLDGDMEVKPDWLEHMLSILSQNGVVGVVGDTSQPEGSDWNRLDRYFYSYYRGARQIGEDSPIHFRWFLFNNTAIRRQALDQIGGFDESYKGYGGEDTDLAIRFWEAFPEGLRFSSHAIAYHHHKRSVTSFCRDMHYFGYTNLPTLLKKYPQHTRVMAGDLAQSLKGRLVFNPFVSACLQGIYQWFPLTGITRHKVVASVVEGLRKYYSENGQI